MEKIKTGNKAIYFKSSDLNGNSIDLAAYKGKKVLISFFRKAACPFCNMGIQELIKRHSEFEEKGIKVITLFASSKEEILKYAGKQNPPFPIIADADYEIYNKYGIETAISGMLKTMLNPSKVLKAIKGGFFSLRTVVQDPVLPADFLIDENQEVYRAHYGKDYDDHLSIDEILNWTAESSATI